MYALMVPALSSVARRSRFSGLATAMAFVRPGPSPAADSGVAARPPSFRTAAFALNSSGEYETTSIRPSRPSGWRSSTAAGHVAATLDQLTHTDASQEDLVLGQGRRDHDRTGVGEKLDREVAHAARGAHNQNGVALRDVERVHARERGDARQRSRPGLPEVLARRAGRHMVVLRQDDQLRPAAGVHGRVRVRHEAVDLVADPVSGDPAAHLLNHSRVVTAKQHGELVLEPLPQHPAGDRGVHRVDRGGLHSDEKVGVAGMGRGHVVAQRGGTIEAVEGERSHGPDASVCMDTIRRIR